MSRFNSVEMAKTVSQHSHVAMNHTFFGIITTARYTETGSLIDSFENFYAKIEGEELRGFLSLSDDQIQNRKCWNRIAYNKEYGNYRLDLCLSRDHKFVAMQLYQFIAFMYRPVTDVRCFEGETAEHVLKLIA